MIDAFFLIAMCAAAEGESPAPLRFVQHALDPASDFEAAGIADVDRDGDLDVVCGDSWYESPVWTKHPIGEIASEGGYRIDFANVPLDVDDDGDADVVSCNWHRRSVLWRENPGSKVADATTWVEHAVDEPGNMETALEVDVDGDGRADFLPDVAQQTVWYSRHANDANGLVRHTISESVGGHGIGFGDVNGDGRGDVLKPGGWFEAPVDRAGGEWRFYADWNLGAVGIGIVVHDFDGDGLSDVFAAMGHDYGTFWLEQRRAPASAASPVSPKSRDGTDAGSAVAPSEKWIRHEIDHDWSQGHALRLADLDLDGRPEVVTGKRKYAHETDPGAEDEMVIFAYAFDRETKSFRRHELSRGGKAGLGLAPGIADLDRDGDLDIVAPGKSGLFLLVNDRRAAR